MDQAPEQQRLPGVKYRRVTRHRAETTVIDGVASTRRVPYDAWEPVPPREWDEVILRGVTGAAITVTVIAAAGTTASIGGLLSPLVPDVFAYASGIVFTSGWLACLGMEWLHRIDPERARSDRNAGWLMLALGMAAVIAYGNSLGHLEAGLVGAAVDLLSKGLWARLIRYHSVPLDPGVAHWVVDQEQKLASRALLTGRLARLNRSAAYREAIGGREYQAAGAILASAQTTPAELPGQRSDTADTPAPEPVQAPAPAPAPQPPLSGQPPVTVSAPVTPPPAPPVPPVAPQPPTAKAQEQQPPAPPVPPVSDITRPSIAAICRREIGADVEVTDAALVAAALKAGHPHTDKLADTVRRSAQRVDPTRKARKVS
ncbi:hypothetical protein ABZX75_17375 [Streptomyces sp. NPDC003038]|uniref:hypothetical protein n=1 Tax=unclassified Streptomyces TaxID=2593676 RepID=UPI0033B54B02